MENWLYFCHVWHLHFRNSESWRGETQRLRISLLWFHNRECYPNHIPLHHDPSSQVDEGDREKGSAHIWLRERIVQVVESKASMGIWESSLLFPPPVQMISTLHPGCQPIPVSHIWSPPQQRRNLVWALSFVQRSRSRARRRWHFMILSKYVLFMSEFNRKQVEGSVLSTCTKLGGQHKAKHCTALPHLKRRTDCFVCLDENTLWIPWVCFLYSSQASVKGRINIQIVYVPHRVTYGECLIRNWERKLRV